MECTENKEQEEKFGEIPMPNKYIFGTLPILELTEDKDNLLIREECRM
jgi:hypothetical protein